MSQSYTHKLIRAALIAAMYTALTLLLAPISYGPWQFRAAEALTVLPFIMPEAILGLTVGCFLSNLLGGSNMLDIIFGTLATLIAALLTYRCKHKLVAIIPPVAVNAVIVGAVLAYTYTPEAFWPGFAAFIGSVGLGQAAVLVVLGLPVLLAAEKILKKIKT